MRVGLSRVTIIVALAATAACGGRRSRPDGAGPDGFHGVEPEKADLEITIPAIGEAVFNRTYTDLQCAGGTERHGTETDTGQAWCERPNGAKHGPFVEVALNGRLVLRGQYVNNRREGPWLAWYPSGNRKWVGWYRDGRRHGNWYETSDGGALFEAGQYTDGARSGTWVMHVFDSSTAKDWTDGALIETVVWGNGAAHRSRGAQVGAGSGAGCEPSEDAQVVTFGAGTLRLPSGWCRRHDDSGDGSAGVIVSDDDVSWEYVIGNHKGRFARPESPTQYAWLRTEYVNGLPLHYGVTETDGVPTLYATLAYRTWHNVRMPATNAATVERTLAILRTFAPRVSTGGSIDPALGVPLGWRAVRDPTERAAILAQARTFNWPKDQQIIQPSNCELTVAESRLPDMNRDGQEDRLVYYQWAIPKDEQTRRKCDKDGVGARSGAWHSSVTVLMHRLGKHWKVVGPVGSRGGHETPEWLDTVIKTVQLSNNSRGLVVRKGGDPDANERAFRCVVMLGEDDKITQLRQSASLKLCDVTGAEQL